MLILLGNPIVEIFSEPFFFRVLPFLILMVSLLIILDSLLGKNCLFVCNTPSSQAKR
jgi:hypothetical protein